MQNEELKVLLQAAARLNIDPSELKAINPWTQNGPRAEAMQMAVEEVAPAMAARWRSDSGSEISLATVAAEAGLREHTAETYADLRQHDPVFVEQEQLKAKEWEAKMEAEMLSRALELATRRGVDPEAMNQPHNPALAGKFRGYFEELNRQAAQERQG